jgi:hypothetical protein
MTTTTIQLKRDTAAIWTSVNRVLADGEIGIEKDTGKWKRGNGTTPWNSLPYEVGELPAHNQAISTITGLQTALDGKAATTHGHAPGEITGTAVITSDSRLADARTPTAHKTSHVTGGSDVIENAVAGGAAGLMSGIDKTIVDGVAAALALKAPLASPALVTPNIGVATGTSLATTGEQTSSGGKVGYSTGAGGTVTQLTSRATGVTLNKLCGNITMFSAAVAAQGVSTFTLTNSFIAATDLIIIRHISATNGGAWNISVVAAAGSCTITVRNISTASITEATPLRFTIIKGVTA